MKEKIKIKTLKVRIKDKHAAKLRAMARDVNFIWNYCNELSSRFIKEKGVFLSGYDFHKYVGKSTQYFTISSDSIGSVACEYALKRKQSKKTILRWRKSHGPRKSLGWIPLRSTGIRWNGFIRYYGINFDVWDSYGLSKYKFKSGSFNEDARGRWYFNVIVEVVPQQSKGSGSVGIDLGLKSTATDSNGGTVPGREFRALEDRLATAQRANKKNRARAIHAKIKNRRADTLHKYSRKLVNENAAIFVGDVSSTKLVKTKMAKSVLDAGWCSLKTMLEYKCDHADIIFKEINEAYSTQACSCCGAIGPNSPKGRSGLRIREWTCSECGAEHDRDVNAARNILVAGHRHLAEGKAKTA